MRFKIKEDFYKAENFHNGKINKQGFSSPIPDPHKAYADQALY